MQIHQVAFENFENIVARVFAYYKVKGIYGSIYPAVGRPFSAIHPGINLNTKGLDGYNASWFVRKSVALFQRRWAIFTMGGKIPGIQYVVQLLAKW